MIGYVTVGSNDLEKARNFYDNLMPTLGAGRIMEFGDNFTMYGTGMGKPGLAICKPFDGNAATAGNGNMASVVCDSRAKVDELVGKAVAAGGGTHAEPKDYGFMYQRAFQDLDGHIWELFWMDPGAVKPQ